MKVATRKKLFLGALISLTMCTTASYAVVPVSDTPSTSTVAPDDEYTVKGVVTDDLNEPLMGVNIIVKGTTNGCTTNLDGEYTLKVSGRVELVFSYIGFQSQTHLVTSARTLNVVLKDDSKMLESVVVTAMGIVRKQTSLTYATQQVKADELMKVEDPNLVNSLDGKIAGVNITQGAGGAGGASKILLRGNKSINGNNSPLIVVDGIPMSNSTRGQISDGNSLITGSASEGSDPLSQINPDDIESINVLKGANAAALYGSQAANGVVMITTKKGKEGKLDVSFNSNVTFDSPLLTPDIQNVYGINTTKAGRFVGTGSWGDKLGVYNGEAANSYVIYTKPNTNTTLRGPLIESNYGAGSTAIVNGEEVSIAGMRDIYMRNYGNDDIADFYSTGVTTNNSISLSGGTEKAKSYFSYANSHAKGMIETNTYNRHTFAFRQNYRLWNRLSVEASVNYVQTKTKNRVGGGTILNPIYHLYTMPRNIDLGYYSSNYITSGTWHESRFRDYWDGSKMQTNGALATYTGDDMQNWAFQSPGQNNPYFLLNQNTGVNWEDRIYGNIQANLDIWDGLSFQARVSIDHSKYNSESRRSATTWHIADMEPHGRYWIGNSKSSEIYTDFLFMYNKTFEEDWSVNASAGYVGHVTKGTSYSTDVQATLYNYGGNAGAMMIAGQELENPLNYGNGKVTLFAVPHNVFMSNADGRGSTTRSRSSNWDRAALATVSLGWKDAVYIDGSYRMDWYRAFRQARFASGDNKAKDHYGYWGFGANFIPSNLWELPDPITYLKYRISYSEVGNSIPNTIFDKASVNLYTGQVTLGNYNSFTPTPETMKSFETGIEATFFNNALNLDVTYYNSKLDGAYLVIGASNGKLQPINTTCIRNQGVELTVGYDWIFAKDWRWKTGVNFSYNSNEILNVYTDNDGNEKPFQVTGAGVAVKYAKGKSYGDMYVTDFDRWGQDVYDADGILIHKQGDIYVNNSGAPSFGGNLRDENGGTIAGEGTGQYGKYIGNMNSPYQLSWSNTFSYKNFSLYFLISGRIGGKVVSFTESYLDSQGVSQRTADLRLASERDNILTAKGEAGMYINEGRDLVPIETYITNVASKDIQRYVYDATNFRLRELSFGYTFRDLFGENKNLNLSFIARNLFFIYNDAPIDPEVSISTGNSMKAYECFNLPSSRSFGVNLKVNF